jgi:predicted dehydrogenase
VAVDFQRLAPFGPRSNSTVDVVIDLMIHDLDLALSLDPSPVRTVSAWGWSISTELTDVAIAHLTFESGMVANFTSSRVAPSLTRKMHLIQDGATFMVDFGQSVFECSQAKTKSPPQVQQLKFEKADPLFAEVESFVNSIQKRQKPLVSGRAGLEALRLAEKVLETINADKE